MTKDLKTKSAADIKAEMEENNTEVIEIKAKGTSVKVLAGKETPKKTEFARLWFELGNKTEAYKQAYDVAPDTVRQVCANEGSKLSRDPYVIKIYEQLQEQKTKASLINVNYIAAQLAEAAEIGKRLTVDDNGRESAIGLGSSVSALSELNRMQGNHAAVRHSIDQKSVNVSISAGEYAQQHGLNLTELGLALEFHEKEGLDQLKAIDKVVAQRDAIEGGVV